MAKLTNTELDAVLHDLSKWRIEDGKLLRDFAFPDFAAAMIFVNKVAGFAESANHHPDIDIRYNQVRLALVSHNSGSITRRDIRLATSIDASLVS